jgi:hypothetical protein
MPLIHLHPRPRKLWLTNSSFWLRNHLIPGVILISGAVGTPPELQQTGFAYVK